jgi:hypothetical protein
MPDYYLTVPTSITPPPDGELTELSGACSLHRVDGAVPKTLTVPNGEYRVFRLSDATIETAAEAAALEILTARTYHSTIGGTTPSFTVDTSDLLVGDTLLVGLAISGSFASTSLAPAATVGAGTLSPLPTEQVGGNNQNHRRMALYSHTMTAPSSTLTFGFTLATTSNNHSLIAVPIRGGVIGTPVGAMDDSAGSVTQSITPAGVPNRIIALHIRGDETFISWSEGVTALTRSPAVPRAQVGLVTDAPAGVALSVTATGTGNGSGAARSVLALVPVTPA